jgi:hypothetical protein
MGSGGALRLLCSVDNSKKCLFNLENNKFNGNSALLSGGSIYYDLYSPKGLMSNQFSENTANYGNSVGSYAFSLKKIDYSNNNDLYLNSGEITEEILSIGIYD